MKKDQDPQVTGRRRTVAQLAVHVAIWDDDSQGLAVGLVTREGSDRWVGDVLCEEGCSRGTREHLAAAMASVALCVETWLEDRHPLTGVQLRLV